MSFYSKYESIFLLHSSMLLLKVMLLVGILGVIPFNLKADGGKGYCFKLKVQTQDRSMEGYWHFVSYNKIHIDSLQKKSFLAKILPTSKGTLAPLVLSRYLSKITFQYPDSSRSETIYGFSKKKQFVIPVKDIIKLEILNSCPCNEAGTVLINHLNKTCKWVLKRPKEVHRYWFEGCAYVLLSYNQSHKAKKIVEQLKRATIEGNWAKVNLLYDKINKVKILVISEGC